MWSRDRARQRNWRRADARRIHRTGQPGRADGAADRRGRLPRPRCGPAGPPASSRTRTPPRRLRARLRSWPRPAIWSACAWSATTTCGKCSTARRSAGRAGARRRSSPSTAPFIPTPAARSPRRPRHRGVSVIDAPVSGGARRSKKASCWSWSAATRTSSSSCRPVFATYADPIVHLGPLGSGQVTKILNNLLFTANLGSAISTLELGESLGVPPRPARRGAQPRIGQQQGARQHRDLRRHPGTCSRRSPARCCRRTSGTPPASPLMRRHRGRGVRRGRRGAEVDGHPR